MRNIVVYKIAFLSCFLLLGMELMAQKPAIDLISSHHHYRHPEAVIDTACTVNPPVRDAVLKQLPPAQEKKQTGKQARKKKRQIGPSLDSLFHKEESKTPAREETQANISLINRRFIPVKFLMFIIAIK